MRWLNGSASSGTLADYLVVGEPDASVTISNPTPTTYTHAGRGFLLALPLLPNGTNAWGTPLIEPGLAASNGIFGASIVTGDYVGDQATYPGQQLIISAREWSQPTPAVSKAGRAYSFRPLP